MLLDIRRSALGPGDAPPCAPTCEDQEIPDGIVAPGTEVLLTVIESGEQQTLTILGPWDIEDDEAINYRAPIAETLLGRSIGEETTLKTLSGSEPVRIEAVQRVV